MESGANPAWSPPSQQLEAGASQEALPGRKAGRGAEETGTIQKERDEETERRRQIQQAYNEAHGITPTTIKKAVRDLIAISSAAEGVTNKVTKDPESMDRQELEKLVKELTRKMHQAAAELNFEEAVVLRDRMVEIKKMILELEED